MNMFDLQPHELPEAGVPRLTAEQRPGIGHVERTPPSPPNPTGVASPTNRPLRSDATPLGLVIPSRTLPGVGPLTVQPRAEGTNPVGVVGRMDRQHPTAERPSGPGPFVGTPSSHANPNGVVEWMTEQTPTAERCLTAAGGFQPPASAMPTPPRRGATHEPEPRADGVAPVPGRRSFGDRCLLVLFACLFVPHSALARDWYKLVTPHFQMFSDARESESRRLLTELETFQYVVSRFLGLTNIQRRPALVYFFADEDDFKDYKPLYNGEPRPVSGFHVEDPLGHAMALSRQAKSSGSMRVLFHEYTHLLTVRQYRDAPLWAIEGVAEVFSTFSGEGDQYDIGTALTNHVYYLQQFGPLPIEKLLQVTSDSPEYNERKRAGKFYATSWLLAHQLIFARRGFETNVMGRYAALSTAMTNRWEAFRLAFGSLPQALNRPMWNYLQGGNYTIVRQSYPDLEQARPVRHRPARGELDYALGRLQQMVRRPDEATERLQKATRLAPGDPRPHEALALEAWRTHENEALRAHLDDALRLGSRDPFTHYLAAEVRFQDLTQGRVPLSERDEVLRAGQKLCEQAIALDPFLAPAHHLLGVYVASQHPRTPAVAMNHVQEALRCDPQYKPARLTLATLMAAQGNLGGARVLLQNLLAGPLPDDLRTAATRIAEDIERRLRPAGRPAAPPPR